MGASDMKSSLVCVLGAALLATACANTPESGDDADRVWMRAGSTANSEFAKNACRAASTIEADFRLCMLSDGWRLETPPSQP